MSRRLSLSLNSSLLRDASSLQNRERRSSIGGRDIISKTETSSQDRHAMLDEWRRKSRARNRAVADEDEHDRDVKRPRGSERLPPAANPSSGLSAIERIRLRRAETERSVNNSFDGGGDDSTIAFSVSTSRQLRAGTPSRRVAGTPGRLGPPARRRSMSLKPSQRNSILSAESDLTLTQGTTLSQPIMSGTQTYSQLSQLSQDDSVFSAPVPTTRGMDTVEDAVVQQLQRRIQDLEKNKMDLSMEVAPLKARLLQKQDTHEKELKKLLQEIEELQTDNQSANERNRDLQMQYENLKETCQQLRYEIRKASSTSHGMGSHQSVATSSGWNRQLQNDRDVAELNERLKAAEDDLDSVRLSKVSVEKELHGTKIELDSLYRSFEELRMEYDAISQSSSNNKEAELKLEHLTTEHIATSAQLNAVCADLAATKAKAEAEVQDLKEEHKKENEQLYFEMSVIKARAGNYVDPSGEVDPENEDDSAVLKARLEEKERRIKEMEEQLQKGEALRRQMHNRIQELRGNIRVFVRTRPFLPSDGSAVDSPIQVQLDGESLSIEDTRNASPHNFKFDKVFPPSSGQDAVFEEVSDFVQSALDGYHVCLFSYGQTGSGKTHTMQGSGIGAMRGIIPRAVEQILQQVQTMQHQKWSFTLGASFLEIYNENLRDLLVSMTNAKSSGRNPPPKLAIKRNRDGKSYVDNLSEIKIETEDVVNGLSQLESLMTVAARSRSVASTKMNAQSSRSHSVFMLHLRGSNEETGAVVHGALNLCDLAGSERLDRSGAGSDLKRLKETQSINKSLSCLGDVFNALATGASHVPYRNSKLTYLLQDCLSGDGKALMFVNLSPTTMSSNESLCSLRFAQRVNQVELGKATKHIEYTHR